LIKAKILVVDDEEGIREIVSALLESQATIAPQRATVFSLANT